MVQPREFFDIPYNLIRTPLEADRRLLKHLAEYKIPIL